ncbi:MAG: hypothetical protein CMN29_17520 [Sandaracinus sp.]|nr:hypothetical protein [Sandaracinus sp.]
MSLRGGVTPGVGELELVSGSRQNESFSRPQASASRRHLTHAPSVLVHVLVHVLVLVLDGPSPSSSHAQPRDHRDSSSGSLAHPTPPRAFVLSSTCTRTSHEHHVRPA